MPRSLVKRSAPAWCFVEDDFDPRRVRHWETLFTLANGYMGLRGSSELSPGLGEPGLYAAGVYDATGTYTDEIVNLPLPLGIRANVDGFDLALDKGEVLDYARVLDMRQGLLFSDLVYKDMIQRRFRWRTVRLVHKREKQLALLWGELTPLDSGETLQLSSTVDAWITKHASGSGRTHLAELTARDLDPGIALNATTLRSKIAVCLASQFSVEGKAQQRVSLDDDRASEVFRVPLRKNRPVRFVKRIVLATSRESKDPQRAAARALRRYQRQSVPALQRSHVSAWADVWKEADVRIQGDDRSQKLLRFSLFHLASLALPEDEHVSLGAKGLHGNGYSGQVFWDTEVYLVPFFIFTDPKAARALLTFRCHGLADARKNAEALGARGVKFPWNASTQTSREHPHPGWQEHLNADIAWAVDLYVTATGDTRFYRDCGARLILETAAYWPSRLDFDADRDRYVMRNVQGPDEIHRGIENNVTTNALVRWHLRRALQVREDMRARGCWPAMCKAARVTNKEVDSWEAMVDRIEVAIDPERGFHEQFDGYFQLKERAIDRSMTKMQYTGPVQHSFRPTQVIQQADVMMLYHMLPEAFPQAVKRRGFQYYEPRCSHTSTLSRCIYAAVAARAGLKREALRLFRDSLETDTGPTAECESGLHLACTGGNWQAALMGFLGLRVRDGRPCFAPCLPAKWERLACGLCWRGKRVHVTVTPRQIQLVVDKGAVEVEVDGTRHKVGRRKRTIRLRG